MNSLPQAIPSMKPDLPTLPRRLFGAAILKCIILLVVLAVQSVQALIVQPYWTENKLRMFAESFPVDFANPVHEVDLSTEVQATFGAGRKGPNMVVYYNGKMFVSFDVGGFGGVFLYNASDLYPMRTAAQPQVIRPDGFRAVIGMAIHPVNGDLYVATIGGGVHYYTAASGYQTGAVFASVGSAGGRVKDVCANLAFDGRGNLWLSTWKNYDGVAFTHLQPSEHLLVCFKNTNAASAYAIRNAATKTYTATSRNGGTKSVHLFSAPEGIVFDQAENLWFTNNNDFALTNDAGDGTFCKISSNWMYDTMLAGAAGDWMAPTNQTTVNFIPGSKPGGLTWLGGVDGLLVNDQGNNHIWRYHPDSTFNAQNCTETGIKTFLPGFEYYGNGSMAIFPIANEPPVITAAMLSHSGLAFSDEVLSVTSTTASDPENAALIFSYQWQFSYNGVSFTTDATVTTAMLSVGLSRDHKLWRCVIRASDGINVSQPFTTQTVNLLPRPPMNVFTGYPYLYSCGLVLRNGVLDAPALFRLGIGSNLPAGLILSHSGAISGTVSPSAAVGAYLITIERYNSFGETVSQTFTLNVQSETPQTLDFRQTDLDGGGWLNGFASHSGGRLYARTDVGGVYRSDDRGDSWKFLTGEATSIAPMHVQGLAVGETSADLVFHTAGSSYTADDAARGVWRSADGGATWSHVLANVNFSGNADISGLHDRSGDDNLRWQGECLAITPSSNDQEIFTITRKNGLWRSTTGGGEGTWTKQGGTLFDGLVGHVVHLHPAFPNERLRRRGQGWQHPCALQGHTRWWRCHHMGCSHGKCRHHFCLAARSSAERSHVCRCAEWS
jgi:Putative Ig domain